MGNAPSYFGKTQSEASRVWDNLESDPVIAAPWHQLFKQVQRTAHVLSELLQNADDAGATEASAEITNNQFVFFHNGEDFNEEHFESICRFGFSNKRVLHTIGFRGIGFKSTFSLGNEVRLATPTLSVAFRRERFTEPIWVNGGETRDRTEVRVELKSEDCLKAVKKNLEAWLESPVSLLFFRNIRCIRIAQREISWKSCGPGPVEGSKWMALSDMPDKMYLLISSNAEEFPEEAHKEIMQERMVLEGEDTLFPPCQVEIVHGAEGRLYVVLPSGVHTKLPFACNAPFIQDPGRMEIKDPKTSPTNKWLLERIGKLAGDTMLRWLSKKDLDIQDRAKAYVLMPDVDRDERTIDCACATAVEVAFEHAIANEDCILTEKGSLASDGACIAVPKEILEVWNTDQVAAQFGSGHKEVLSSHIDPVNRQKLANWNAISSIDVYDVLSALKSQSISKPTSRLKILNLWAYLSPDLTSYQSMSDRFSLRIVPVRGKKELFAAEDVVRLGKERLLDKTEDWELISDYVLVFDRVFTRFLTEQQKIADRDGDPLMNEKLRAATALLQALKLNELSRPDEIMKLLSKSYFDSEKRSIDESIRIAQIAAKLNVAVPDDFPYYPDNEIARKASNKLVVDIDKGIGEYVTRDWFARNVLHSCYSRHFVSCSQEEWRRWAQSDKSGLLTFVPIMRRSFDESGMRDKLTEGLRRRGLKGELEFPYKSYDFRFDDWDFSDEHWEYWEHLSENDPKIWGKVMDRIIEQPKPYWADATVMRAFQVGQTGGTKPITAEKLLPSWVKKFRELACLKDTKGRYRQPAELLRRTAETEPLLQMEGFVAREYDTEPLGQLLTMLGVRDTPTSPAAILERLKALSKASNPPISEIEKWYQCLDDIAQKCQTKHLNEIRGAFESSKIIYTADEAWASAREVFIFPDEESAPGASLVNHRFRSLSLWVKIGIAERPTAEIAIEWLKQVEPGKKLGPDELKRIKLLLPKYPHRIWVECGHWLNIEGQWHSSSAFEFALSMQSLVPWGHLFPHIKRRTADLQKLPSDICSQPPFSNLIKLVDAIENRFAVPPRGKSDLKGGKWLALFGRLLQRALFERKEKTELIRGLAARLAQTTVYIASELEIVPFINGAPAGTAKQAEAFWHDTRLYVIRKPNAQMVKPIADEIGRAFEDDGISEALKICFDRPGRFIRAFFEEYFDLEEEIQELEVEAGQLAQKAATGIDAKGPDPDVLRDSEEDLEGSEEEADEDDSGVEIEDDTPGIPEDEPQAVRVVRQREQKASIVERWCLLNGFRKGDSDGCFVNERKEILRRERGMAFQWIKYSEQGIAVHHYWGREHCLEREPLSINAEIWELCRKEPDTRSLILIDTNGSIVEYTGRKLIGLLESGKLVIHPAQYRIEYMQEGELYGGEA